MQKDDFFEYYKFTGPARFDKAIHTLEGIVEGVTIDGRLNDKELSFLMGWIGEHREFANRHPFNELIPRIDEVLQDQIIDEEEKADILWLCHKLTTDQTFYSQITSDMQRLQGVVGGIVADGKISEEELTSLQAWMDEHEQLRTCWPYDELEAIILDVLRDGVIDSHEHDALVYFFSEFVEFVGHRAIEARESELPDGVTGVCAVCPEIEFTGRSFCFTGRSERFTRQAFAEEITKRGGVISKAVTKKTHYLTVGADGNPCWAYACYGRKVEQAIRHRKAGVPIVLVHEYDLWDALADS